MFYQYSSFGMEKINGKLYVRFSMSFLAARLEISEISNQQRCVIKNLVSI